MRRWYYAAILSEAESHKAPCLSFLSNAVLVWNTVHMTRIVGQAPGGKRHSRTQVFIWSGRYGDGCP